MTDKIILKAVAVDESGNELFSEIISSKEIIRPTDISNFGYNHQECLGIMDKVQQVLVGRQAVFLKSTS